MFVKMKTPLYLTVMLLSALAFLGFRRDTTKEVTLTGQLSNCSSGSLSLFQHDGIQLKAVQAIPLTPNADGKSFKINTKLNLEPGFYFIGETEKNYKIVLLGSDEAVDIQGFCNQFQQLVVNSAANKKYAEAMAQAAQFQQEFQGLLGEYRQAGNNQNKINAVKQKMAALDQRQSDYLKGLEGKFPIIYNVVALQTYLSYQNNHAPNETEQQYFVNNYVSGIDFNSPSFNRIPHLMDRSRNFAQTLTQIGITDDSQVGVIKTYYSRFPKGSIARKSALAGGMLGFMDKNNTAFAAIAQLYKAEFGNQNPQITQFIDNKLGSMKSQIIGGEAPEIVQASPEGEMISLSSLRGKIVMIDFWASWCGPCRRENPHVKKLYNQYKSKGFEIYGVSLDRKKANWVAAIQKDGLPWVHVSDLKGWSSAPAATYGVRSIPQTVLVDREGKIIARNLRGPALDAKLAEIFANE